MPGVVLVVLLPLLFAAPARPTTYYVDCAAANDQGSGTTTATAWRTIGRVNGGSFNPGDSILFRRGCTWRESLWPPSSGAAEHPITFGAYGSGANPIISGAEPITDWAVVSGNVYWAELAGDPGVLFINNVVGNRRPSRTSLAAERDWYWERRTGRLYLYAAGDPDTAYTNPGIEYRVRNQSVGLVRDHLIIDGLTAEKSLYANFHGPDPGSHGIIRNCIAQYADNGIVLGGADSPAYTDWQIFDNVCRFNAVMGISVLYRATQVRVFRNRCYENDTLINDGGGGWTGGIKLFDGTDTMEAVEVYENDSYSNGRGAPGDTQGRGVGIWVDAVQPPTHPILVHHNRVRDCSGNGIFVEISSNTRVWANVVSNCGTNVNGVDEFTPAGIAVDTREALKSNDNFIYNNTVYGGRAGLKCASYDQQSGVEISNNQFKNNIVIGQSERRLLAMLGGDNIGYGSGNVYEYNCLGPEAAGFIQWGSALKSTYAAWESAYGGPTRSVQGDPRLVDAGNGDLALLASSPCIDAGADLGASYSAALVPAASWPGNVLIGDQSKTGARWEIGAYLFVPPATFVPRKVLRSQKP